MVFWFCVASAGAGLLFVPFLTIGTQGHESKATSVTSVAGAQSLKAKGTQVAVDAGDAEK